MYLLDQLLGGAVVNLALPGFVLFRQWVLCMKFLGCQQRMVASNDYVMKRIGVLAHHVGIHLVLGYHSKWQVVGEGMHQHLVLESLLELWPYLSGLEDVLGWLQVFHTDHSHLCDCVLVNLDLGGDCVLEDVGISLGVGLLLSTHDPVIECLVILDGCVRNTGN